MAEKRKFERVICVKSDAKTAYKIELFCATQWSKSAQGRYRLRINRRWHNAHDGAPVYLDMAQVGALVAGMAGGKILSAPPGAPNLPRSSSVSVPNGNVIGGQVMYDLVHTLSDPIRAHDGRWYVLVQVWGRGPRFAAVDTLVIRTRWLDGRHVPAQGRIYEQA